MIRDAYYPVLLESRMNLLSVLNDMNDDEFAHFTVNIKFLLTEYELVRFSKEK